MQKYYLLRCCLTMLLMGGLAFGSNAFGANRKPTILKPCKQCHEPEENVLRGNLKSISQKAKTMRVFMGSAVWQVTFNNSTKLEGAKAFNKIGNGRSIAVAYKKEGNVLVATRVEAKMPAEIPKEWVIDVKEMERYMALGQEKGKFSLYDTRPGMFFLEGHIEGAISLYDAMFDKNAGKLPKDKDRTVIFYCAGVT